MRGLLGGVIVAGLVLASSVAMAGVYSNLVLTDNPIAYWRLGEASGTAAADEKAGNPGAYVGSPTLAQAGALVGDADTAVRLSGSGQYVNIPDAAALNFNGGANGLPFTLEAWVKKNSNFTYCRVVDKTQAGAPNGYGFDMSDTNFRLLGATNLQVNYNTTGDTTNWYHLAAVSNGAGTGSMYVNGKLAGSGAFQAQNAWNGALRIGADSDGSSNLPATVDEVAVYGTALTRAQIAQHYIVGSGMPILSAGAPDPNRPDLRLWFNADDASKFTLGGGDSVQSWTDSSANASVASQANSVQQPTRLTGVAHDHAVVRFVGGTSNPDTGDMLSGATDVAANKTMFIVMKDNGTASNLGGTIYTRGANANSSNGIMSGYGTSVFEDWPGGGAPSTPLPPKVFSLVTATYDNSTAPYPTLSIYLDGQLKGTLSSTNPAAKGYAATFFELGARNEWQDNYARWFTGDIAEVLVYDGVLSAAERSLITGYLMEKYVIPEPGTLALLGLGIASLARWRRSRRA